MFIGNAELAYFDATGKGLANTVWRCWAIQNGNNGTEDATGRFFVARDTGDTDFDIVAETGGAKTVTLTIENMVDHIHLTVGDTAYMTSDAAVGSPTVAPYVVYSTASVAMSALSAASTGEMRDTLGVVPSSTGDAFSILPPYTVRIPVQKIC